MKTPVQPARAISRTSEGSSVTSMLTAALQILSSGRSAPAKFPKIIRTGAEVVVGEDGVGLAVATELVGDLLDVSHQVGHVQPFGRQVAEVAAVVATSGGNQACCGQKGVPIQQISPRGGVVPIRSSKSGPVDGLKPVCLHVPQDISPERDSIADRQCVGMLGGLFGARNDVQTTQHDDRPSISVPSREFVGPMGEGQVYRDADDLGDRVARRWPLEQVLIPVSHVPVGRRAGGDARQGKRRGQHVLAEAGVGIPRDRTG